MINDLTGTVKGDGTLVLKVYFKKAYTITYTKGTKGTFPTQSTNDNYYGNQTPTFVGQKTGEVGYTFIGWKKENTGSILSDANIAATTVTGNATYVAQWQANTNTQYKIQFYYQNNGAYSTTPNASQNRTGTTDTTASATTADKTPNNSIAPAPTNNKYVLDTAAPNVLSGNIAGNGSLVLKVYFKPQYTVIYKPGTKGTFTEQKTENIDHGSNTPAFTGTTTGKPGYDFTGWSPTIVSTVTANATYVAQWRARTDTKYKVQYYYEENGSYPTTPNGDRLATDGIKETIRQGTTDTTANVTTADKTPKNNVSNYKYDTTAANVVSGNIEGDGSLVLKVYFKEIPVNYNVDVILTDTKGTELNQNKFNILKQQGTGSKTQVWNNNTVTNSAEVQERRIKIDNYTYEIRELEAPNKNYVNVLEGKYIKVSTAVAQDGTVSISDWKVYNSSNDSLVATTDPVYQKVSVTLKSPTSGFKTIEVKVINPVTFTVEVEKVDTDGNKLADTGIEIKSEIIDEQNAVHKDEVEKEAVTNMTNTGLVTGTTNDQGIVKYDETWVDANSATTGFYTYVIKETQTAGAQYVNILQGYEIVVRVHVEPDGTLTLVNKNGQRYNANDIKYAIRPVNGAELPTTNDLYKYVKVEIENNSINALIDHTGRLEVDVTNPVRYNVNLNVKDTKNQNLAGTNFKVNRANTQVFSGEPGTQVEIAEGPMNAGTYTYYITENSAPNAKYVNVLSGKYIKLVLKVDGNGVVSILDANQNINSDYYEVYSGNINDVNKSSHTRVTDNNVLKYISVNPSNSNGLYTINANIINPVKYQVDIITRDTSNNFLTGTNVVAYRDTVKLYDNDATEQKEITEDIMDANQYVYYFTQTGKKDENYVNVLEGKYIKAVVTLNPNGTLVLNSTELYQGRIGDAGATKVTTGSVLNYFNVSIVQGELDTLQVIIKNPVEFKFEVDTVDSGDTKDEDGKPIKSPLGNTGIEISSPIIDAQNKEHNNEIISGVTSITNDGKVKGTTTDYVDNGVKARVSYEETWVNAGTYTYEIRETKTAGNQYVNILNGYKVVVRVKVDADGRLTLVNRSGTAYASDVQDKFEIVADDGSEVPEDIYTYVDVVVNNGKVKAILNAQIENPVRYNVAIHETVYGKEQIPLAGMPVEVSGFTPKTTLVTGNNGSVQIEESPVRADTYKYMITQLDAVNGVAVEDEFVNILDGYYIGVDLRVHSNGVIKTVNSNGDETTVDYKLYKRNEQGELQEISFNDTIVDDFVKVKITEGEGEENENVYTLNVYIQIPEKFNLKLIKSDVDTAERLNNVEFSIVAKDSAGEISLKDTTTGKDAKTAFETIDTSKLFTANVNDEDGIIEVNNILIEKAGTYRFYISETTPEVEGLIYKDKSEPVVAQVEIDVENGKYVVKGLQIVQASRYTLLDECSITGDETKTVNVSIINERIKGSYDLITKTLNKFTDELIDGGIYKITVKNEEGEELVLYVSDDNVLSQNLVLPYEGDVNGDIEGTSVLPIEDVRIELPGTYTILIQELKSTENFTDLDDIIEFTVTTARKGEFDNEEYVVEKTELKEANHGLVTVTNTDHQIDVVVRKEYFDLALRQYITKVNEKEFEDRIPTVELEAFNRNESTTAVYNQKKQPQRAYAGNEVIYTIEVFNEGLIDGYAQEITEYLPEGLEFVDDEFNKEQGWKYDAESNKVVTRKLAKENEGVIENSADKAIDNIMGEATEESAGNLIKAYNKATSKMDSRKVQLKLKVSEDIKLKSKLTTIAEITEVLAEDRKQTLERDSKQFVNVPEGEELANYKDDLVELPYIAGDEDDDDFEKLLIEEFDLATVKYITKVNDKEVEGESIELSLADEKADEYKEGVFTGFKYKVNREIEKVKQNDKVTYSIRVYNEGTVPAYADEVIDIIPKDLAFDPESEINKKYGWVMMDENNEVTTDISKARYVSTNYLSKATQDDKNAKIEEAIAKGEEPNVEIDSIVIPDTIDIPVKESEGDDESKATEEGTEPAGDEGEVTEEGTEPTENEGEGTEEGTEPEGDEGEGTEEGTEPTGDEGEGTEEGTEPTGDEGEGTEEETEPAGDEGEATENGDNSEEESLVEEEKTSRVNNLMLAKVVENGKVTIDYRQLEIEFTVKEPISEDRTITNVALTPTYNDDLEIGVTDIEPIEVLKEHIEKIYVKSFDLSLKQEINKIIVTAANGETIGEFSLENGDDISKLAKVDIPKNKLEGSEVRVEYKITVTNEGETSGYVSEITDHIPEGFIFRLEDNPDWSCADGVYTYNALEDVLLNPEESKEITIVLIWNNIANIGNKANLVEITKHLDENKLEVVDIDSTPGNLVLTEDDIDLTTVIIAVKTGQIRTVAMILSALCFIIAIGSTIVYMRNERKNKEDDVEETHE
ncbi:MAG: hypothetical protein IKQ33_03580 [Clostridia bacterium]|nr:hypothetical protein [Clostridia bacterium]